MDPALKRQRISAPAAQERFCEEKARFFSSLKRPQTLDNSASHKDCNGFTRFYGAVNAREKGFTSYEEAENFEEAEVDDEDMYEDMSEDDAYEEEAPEANMEAARQKLDNKLKSTFEAIFEKYGKDFSGIGDEIDLRTGEIIVDNGHLAEMHNETDAGKGRGRGILRAFTEEPEQAGFSRHGGEDNVEDYYDVDEASDSMDYHARGRQMLRGSTQEPDLGQESGTEEDEDDYSRDTVRQNAAADDDSSDDDILYQNSGIIPAKSLAFLPMALPAEARRSPENAPIVPSHNSAHPVRRSPESASVVVSHSVPRESLASGNADQSMNDNELLGTDDNEPDSDWERDDSASDSAQNFKLRKRTGNKKQKRKPLGRTSRLAAKPRPGRKTYTEEDNQALLAWVEWVRTETNYPLWSAQHWNMFSEKNARHTGPAWQQHYRRSLETSRDQHLFPRIMMADKAIPKSVRKWPRSSGDGNSVVDALELDQVANDYPDGPRTKGSIVGAPGLNQPTEDEPVGQQIYPRTEMTHEGAPEPPIVQPQILADEGSAVRKQRRDQAVNNRLSGDIQTPQELPGTGESAKTGQWEQFKHTIWQLYIVEDYTLDSVIKIMTDQYAFQAHKALYKVYLSKWGLKKNRMYGELGSMSVAGLHPDAKGRPDDAARDPQKPSRGQPGYKWWNEPQYEGLSRVEAVYKKRRLERAAKRKARVGARGSVSATGQGDEEPPLKRAEEAKKQREMLEKGAPLPPLSPDARRDRANDLRRARRAEQRRLRRETRAKGIQFPTLDPIVLY